LGPLVPEAMQSISTFSQLGKLPLLEADVHMPPNSFDLLAVEALTPTTPHA
jgi:hypothetical protein